MAIRYAQVEEISPEGDEGFVKAILGVREAPMGQYHGMAIQILAKDLTTLVERTHRVLAAFNRGKE